MRWLDGLACNVHDIKSIKTMWKLHHTHDEATVPLFFLSLTLTAIPWNENEKIGHNVYDLHVHHAGDDVTEALIFTLHSKIMAVSADMQLKLWKCAGQEKEREIKLIF